VAYEYTASRVVIAAAATMLSISNNMAQIPPGNNYWRTKVKQQIENNKIVRTNHDAGSE